MSMRTRNSAVTAKIESVEGVSANPGVVDAILVENPTISFEPNIIDTEEVTGSLDSRAPIVGGMRARIGLDVYLKGSGVPGTAPEWGKLMLACGFAESIKGSATGPEALAAGGSTTTAVLGATAATIDQVYRGMPIVFTGAVPGTAFIADYTAAKLATLTDMLGGALIATTQYTIPANIRYLPASTSLPTLTFRLFKDGVRYEVVGCRGTVTGRVQSGSAGRLSFQFTGLLSSNGKIDAGVPAGLVYDATRPPIWRAGAALIHRVASAMASLSFDLGNAIVSPDDPNAAEGYKVTEITSRRVSGSVDPLEELVATRDVMTVFKAGTAQILHARWGVTAGNRIGVTFPTAIYSNQEPGDREGLSMVNVPFRGVGEEAGIFITQW